MESGDTVVSMSILNHIDVETEERDAYLRYAAQKRREGAEVEEAGAETAVETASEAAETPAGDAVQLSAERLAELEAKDELILTITAKGFGKRTSAYEYRVTGRGGQGIANIETSARNGTVAASFPVTERDQIMLVTDGGQLIRCPIHDIRVARRQTQGVTVFKVAGDEQVVAVAHLPDIGEDAEEAEGTEGTPESAAAEATAPERVNGQESDGPGNEDGGDGGNG
jgi:DNA gyrase subunit A